MIILYGGVDLKINKNMHKMQRLSHAVDLAREGDHRTAINGDKICDCIIVAKSLHRIYLLIL